MEDKIKMLSSTSGAAKKRKQKKIEESKAKLPKITSFLKGANKEIVEKIGPDISNNLRDNVTNLDDHPIESVNKNPSTNNNEPIIFNTNVNLINTENVNIVNEPESFEVDLPKPQTLILENTDIGSFQGKTLTDHLKTMIIFSPSCRPTGPFPRDPLQNNRKFSKIYYQRQTKQGFVERAWLCYSLKLDAVYCEPCWLFSNISQDQWHNHGIRDWKHLSQKISQHENSKSHLTSCFVYDQWKQNRSLNTKIEEQYRYNVSFWAQVLERLFSITLALSKNSLAFRGHRESITDTYNGNFLTQVKLLAKYDDVLKHIMSMPKGSIKYLSPQIQNEIIHCLANELRRVLISKIKTAPFYSIIIDTTQDISKKDQLSEVYRYVNIIKNEKSEPVSIEIEEVFLGFSEVYDHSAVGLSTKIKQLLHNNNMDLLQCRGQGYDGARVMSGAYGGVQALIRQVQPNALYVHCASHNLNLAINDAAKCSIEVESFFTTLEDIYTFFGSSINRWDLLSKFTGESTITLKKLNPTRWAGRYMSLLAIKLRYIDIMKALNEINLNTHKPDERNEAIRIIKIMSTFEFIFICIILTEILSQLNLVSKLLQSKNVDLLKATDNLKNAKTNLEKFRNGYENAKANALNIASKWKVNPEFSNKRKKIIKKHFDELAQDFRFENNEHAFKINVFYKVLDVVCCQLHNRFVGMNEVCNLFNFMSPSVLISLPEKDIMEYSQKIQLKYSNDLSAEFPLQLVMLVSMTTIKEELAKLNSIKEFLEFLIKQPLLTSSVPEVATALILFLTLPVTSANAERSFSKLKLIKNYLRSTQEQERLSDLAILAIEAKEAEKMDIKELIKTFSELKARKKNF